MKQLVETVCDRERVAIVFNPVSGTEDTVARRARLEDMVQAAGLGCGIAETDRDHGATPLAEKAVADGIQRLLVSGGDGSVTEAAQVLAGTPVELAVIPAGTGNVLASNLGIPSDAEETMRLALTQEARPFDVGRANGRVFLVCAGMGADGRIIQDADREAKRRLGMIAYFAAGWRNLGKHYLPFTVTVDGQTVRRRAQMVLVTNVGSMPGGIALVPGSNAEDGVLEVAILRARGVWRTLMVGARAMFGRPQSDDEWEILRGRHIVIEAPDPQPVQVDGNEAGMSRRLDVTVEPDGLMLVRPPAQAVEETHDPITVQDVNTLIRYAPVIAAVGIGALAVVFLRRRAAAIARQTMEEERGERV